MTAGSDINELTISGHIEHPPELREDYDGLVCEFVLTHIRACPDSGHWQLHHYSVAIYGQRAQVFADTYHPDEMVVIAGRLDCHHRRIQDGYEPIATIIADTIATAHGPAQDSSQADALPA